MSEAKAGGPIVAYADIVDTDPAPGIAILEEAGFNVVVADSADPMVLHQRAGQAVALLIGYATVDARVLDALPNLRLVATQSVGVDTVDLAECGRRGIAVSNVPGAATEEVASHALAMTLALLRGLPMLHRDVRAGRWDGAREVLRRPSDLTVGVIGLGRIGRRYAQMVRPLVGNVIGHDPVADRVDGIEMLDLDDLLAASDVVSLHLPLTDQTHHLLDDRRLSLLPGGAAVVNVARGPLIDAAALLAHLDSGHLSSAALDVMEVEPPGADDPLVRHARTLVTPHAAYMSAASVRDYVVHQAQNVVTFHQTGRCPDLVDTDPPPPGQHSESTGGHS